MLFRCYFHKFLASMPETIELELSKPDRMDFVTMRTYIGIPKSRF